MFNFITLRLSNGFLPVMVLFLFVAVGLSSCKKDKSKDDAPKQVEFTFSAPESLTFEHSGTKQLPVSIQGGGGHQIVVRLKEVSSPFSAGSDVIVYGDQTAQMDVQFSQFNATPGAITAQVEVALLNENQASKTKSVQLVYAPNCAYGFRERTLGNITYQINGLLENKTISCEYNSQGQLVVQGLSGYTMVLDFDCPSQTVSMSSFLYQGSVMTAEGFIESQQVVLSIYNEGELHAMARIL